MRRIVDVGGQQLADGAGHVVGRCRGRNGGIRRGHVVGRLIDHTGIAAVGVLAAIGRGARQRPSHGAAPVINDNLQTVALIGIGKRRAVHAQGEACKIGIDLVELAPDNQGTVGAAVGVVDVERSVFGRSRAVEPNGDAADSPVVVHRARQNGRVAPIATRLLHHAHRDLDEVGFIGQVEVARPVCRDVATNVDVTHRNPCDIRDGTRRQCHGASRNRDGGLVVDWGDLDVDRRIGCARSAAVLAGVAPVAHRDGQHGVGCPCSTAIEIQGAVLVVQRCQRGIELGLGAGQGDGAGSNRACTDDCPAGHGVDRGVEIQPARRHAQGQLIAVAAESIRVAEGDAIDLGADILQHLDRAIDSGNDWRVVVMRRPQLHGLGADVAVAVVGRVDGNGGAQPVEFRTMHRARRDAGRGGFVQLTAVGVVARGVQRSSSGTSAVIDDDFELVFCVLVVDEADRQARQRGIDLGLAALDLQDAIVAARDVPFVTCVGGRAIAKGDTATGRANVGVIADGGASFTQQAHGDLQEVFGASARDGVHVVHGEGVAAAVLDVDASSNGLAVDDDVAGGRLHRGLVVGRQDFNVELPRGIGARAGVADLKGEFVGQDALPQGLRGVMGVFDIPLVQVVLGEGGAHAQRCAIERQLPSCRVGQNLVLDLGRCIVRVNRHQLGRGAAVGAAIECQACARHTHIGARNDAAATFGKAHTGVQGARRAGCVRSAGVDGRRVIDGGDLDGDRLGVSDRGGVR